MTSSREIGKKGDCEETPEAKDVQFLICSNQHFMISCCDQSCMHWPVIINMAINTTILQYNTIIIANYQLSETYTIIKILCQL
jgi:hypothetical protein